VGWLSAKETIIEDRVVTLGCQRSILSLKDFDFARYGKKESRFGLF